MVKPLAFKGEKPKKRKRTQKDEAGDSKEDGAPNPKTVATTATTSHASNQQHQQTEDAAEDENWVSAEHLSDIAGPIMFVLPTTRSPHPPTSLSVDQLGKVFAQKIENLVDGLPDSAEPHDVRQVWIATRVVGSEGDFTFKGHHGRFLACDRFGLVTATREAMGPEERFCLRPVEGGDGGGNGLFEVQSGRGTYISLGQGGEEDADTAALPEVRGDAEEAGENTRIRIRMQARFKPKHKVEKAEKVRAKISRKELEEEVGRRLDDEEVRKLKRARREGNYHEAMLDVKVKGKHDKFA
ncbi:actin-crosslinking protein [Hortaea werneckii]|nr:actin-crosslinking protein [Hortaea werneckii]KAI6999158.1 actin-crosslinking protein [Hortaea werneckii]KAI7148522.1 actin-crosslinking protein [Hortaea werneckii]KAI7179244.1 actin-crosslinking protein [Hortaea werneckii]